MKLHSANTILVCAILFHATSCNLSGTSSQTATDAYFTYTGKQQGVEVFDYIPPRPVRGVPKAIVEIGDRSISYYLIVVDQQKRWELRANQSHYFTSTSRSQLIDSTLNYLKKYMQFATSNKVDKNNQYIFIQSDLKASFPAEPLLKAMRALDIEPIQLTTEQEAKYLLTSSIPPEFMDEAFLVDVTASHTKLTWSADDKKYATTVVGTQYYTSGKPDSTAFRMVRSSVLQIPPAQRSLCFLSGRIFSEFKKKQLEDSSHSRYIPLNSPDNFTARTKEEKAIQIIYSAIYLPPTFSYIWDQSASSGIGYVLENDTL